MSRYNQVGKVATTIGPSTIDGKPATAVRYHGTNVVTFNEDKIILKTGGYFTNTTKTRMNQASQQFGLGFRVSQYKFSWRVDFKGTETWFGSNIVILERKEKENADHKDQ